MERIDEKDGRGGGGESKCGVYVGGGRVCCIREAYDVVYDRDIMADIGTEKKINCRSEKNKRGVYKY